MLRNILSAAVLLVAFHSSAFAQAQLYRWAGTWDRMKSTSAESFTTPGPALAPFMPNMRCGAPTPPPVAPPPGQTFAPAPYIHFTNQTLRQIVRTTIGGSRARVVLSNAYGTAPITIGAAHIALRDKDSVIQASGRPWSAADRRLRSCTPMCQRRLFLPFRNFRSRDRYVLPAPHRSVDATMPRRVQTNTFGTGNHAASRPSPPWAGLRAGSCSRASTLWRLMPSARSSRSATRLPTARDRRPTPITGGPIISPGACSRRESRWAC